MSLENRVAIITGATGNLGRVVSANLAKQGARLALVGTNNERLKKLGSELNLSAERLLTHAANLRDPNSARELAQAVDEKFGRADILVHLVGGWLGGKTVVEFAAHETDEMLQQHLWTTWHLAQAFVPRFSANHWGRLIVISSPTATRPVEKSAPYAIAKAAQETLMLTLAQELKGSGVTANVLQVRTIDAQHERDKARTPHNASWTTPEEIAAAIFYLCSDEAHVVNGARISLDGGAWR
jgi:NAD(P)-dependent dehydrogenase (short-subunit alcohol dehydrogenase family)